MRLWIFIIAILVTLAACGHGEILEPLGASAPPGVDFSGNWRLREPDSAGQREILRAIDETDGVKRNQGQAARRSTGDRSGRRGSGLVHVFLETGRQLKITQTPHGFFVSVDRSVVEEFRFGEQRIINVGEIEAQRVSGWVDSVYVVETLDKKGMKLTERFWIDDDQNTLNREIIFRSAKKESSSVMQYFDREE